MGAEPHRPAGGSRSLYRRNADGTDEAELLLSGAELGPLAANAWSPNGDTLVVMSRRARRNALLLLSMEDLSRTELPLEAEFSETRAAVSPNGEWIAYESDRFGEIEVYVERFQELGDRQRISTGGGQQPLRSPHGSELFFLSVPDADRIMAVPVNQGSELIAGDPEVVFEGQLVEQGGNTSYDVHPDGRLLVIRLGGEAVEETQLPQINMILNWVEELERLVPIDQ